MALHHLGLSPLSLAARNDAADAAASAWWGNNVFELEALPNARARINSISYNSIAALLASSDATFARASEGYYFNGTEYELFASGEVRIGDNGLLIEPASTRITSYPTELSSWSVAVASVSSYPGTYLGVFSDAVRVASAGAAFHRVFMGSNTAITSGTPIGVVMYYSAGTSGRVRIVVRDVDGANSSIISGAIGSEAVIEESAGTITVLSCVTENGIVECTFTFTPNFTNSSLQIGLGPDSGTSGEDVIYYAGWAETAYPGTTPILSAQSEGESRSADVLTLLPSANTYDITATFDDDSTQSILSEVIGGGGWAVPDNLDRPYIKNIAGVLS